jgi:tetratricopeptide (TPR) repeat protein
VNFYGDTVGIELPHSHLEAALSALWWQDEDPRDARTATFPELAPANTFADYVEGRDPVLELAMTTTTPPDILEVLKATLPRGVQSTVDAYQLYVSNPAHKYLPDPEQRVNSLGYQLLSAKKVQDAIQVFEVNALVHPKSSNAYDSMAEGYADAGENQHAIEAYRKSLELNPGNDNAKRMIRELEQGK